MSDFQTRLTEARKSLETLTSQIRRDQNEDREVEITTHMVAGRLAQRVINLEIEAARA